MIPQRWQHHIDLDFQFAEKALKADGRLMPTFAIHTKTGIVIVGAAFESTRQKRQIHDLVRLMALAQEAEGVSALGEVWLAHEDAAPGETDEQLLARARPPTQREDRREAVSVMLNYRDPATGDVKAVSTLREIERDETGVTGLGAPMQNTDPTGPTAQLLTEHRPTEVQVAMARHLLPIFAERAGLSLQGFEVSKAGHA